jgi:hypothetical protein
MEGRALAAGDLDRDGFTDLVAVDATGETLGVLMNNRDGTFRSPVAYPAAHAAWPDSVKIGDFNDDGIPDVVFKSDDSLLLFPGIGDGRLGTPVAIAEDAEGHVAIGDFNGDGLPDLAAADFAFSVDAGVSLYFSTAGGGLVPGKRIDAPTATEALWEMASGDLNGDRVPDLAVAILATSGLGSLGILLNRGDGTFGSWNSYPAGGPVYSIAFADIDRDGANEVLFTSASSSTGVVTLNQLTLSSGSSGALLPEDIQDQPGAIIVGDFNGDQAPDVALVASGIEIYLNGCP